MHKVFPRIPARSFRRGLMRAEVVVLALVLWLLAALVIPTIAKSQQQARTQGTRDRMRQISTLFNIYHDLYRSLPVIGRPQDPGSRPAAARSKGSTSLKTSDAVR